MRLNRTRNGREVSIVVDHATRGTLTIEEAAKRLGVSRWLAYEEVRRTGFIGGVPVLRVGRRLLVPRAALERVLSGDAPPVAVGE